MAIAKIDLVVMGHMLLEQLQDHQMELIRIISSMVDMLQGQRLHSLIWKILHILKMESSTQARLVTMSSKLLMMLGQDFIQILGEALLISMTVTRSASTTFTMSILISWQYLQLEMMERKGSIVLGILLSLKMQLLLVPLDQIQRMKLIVSHISVHLGQHLISGLR